MQKKLKSLESNDYLKIFKGFRSEKLIKRSVSLKNISNDMYRFQIFIYDKEEISFYLQIFKSTFPELINFTEWKNTSISITVGSEVRFNTIKEFLRKEIQGRLLKKNAERHFLEKITKVALASDTRIFNVKKATDTKEILMGIDYWVEYKPIKCAHKRINYPLHFESLVKNYPYRKSSSNIPVLSYHPNDERWQNNWNLHHELVSLGEGFLSRKS